MSDEINDDKLFSQAMQGVDRMQSDKVNLKTKPSPIKKRAPATEPSIADTLSDDFIPPCEDHLEFMRSGVQKAYLKQIRNGKIPI